jgi:hypothetical protein
VKDKRLPNNIRVGLSDPFILVKLGKKTVFKSSIKSETLNPLWNETFEIAIYPGMPEIMVLEVLDHDLFKSDDFLGLAHLSTSQIIKEGFSGWLKLERAEKGELHVEAEYLPPETSECKSFSPLFLQPTRRIASQRKIFSNGQELIICFNFLSSDLPETSSTTSDKPGTMEP